MNIKEMPLDAKNRLEYPYNMCKNGENSEKNI